MKLLELSDDEVVIMFKTIITGKQQRGCKKLAKKLIKFVNELKKEIEQKSCKS